jgi:hypothetical protein
MARQTKPAQSVYDFDVHQEPLLTTDGKRTGYFGMVRRDTAEPITLGVCTEQYGVVKNADLIEMVETNLANHDKLSNFTSKKFVVRDGARFYASYDFTDFKTELKPVGKRAKGDILGLRLVVNNSYDRSTRVSLSLGFLRLICENGMTSLTKEFSMTKRHTLAVNLDFVGDALAHACDSVESSAQVFNKLAQKDNLYNLYNAATQFLTRNVSQERYEYSERVNRDLLKVFSGKTRDEDLLKLVA